MANRAASESPLMIQIVQAAVEALTRITRALQCRYPRALLRLGGFGGKGEWPTGRGRCQSGRRGSGVGSVPAGRPWLPRYVQPSPAQQPSTTTASTSMAFVRQADSQRAVPIMISLPPLVRHLTDHWLAIRHGPQRSLPTTPTAHSCYCPQLQAATAHSSNCPPFSARDTRALQCCHPKAPLRLAGCGAVEGSFFLLPLVSLMTDIG